MTLRRTPLVRKTPMRRTPLPKRKVDLNRRRIRATKRPRDTGPSTAVRELVIARAGGRCEVCGVQLKHPIDGWLGRPYSLHHRQPRGMGGSRHESINRPSNLLLLCGTGTTGCHGRIEANRSWAIRCGLLVPMGTDPATTPIWFSGIVPLLLADDGTYKAVA